VRERAAYAIEIANRNHWLLDIALDHISLGRAALALGEHGEARTQLDRAVDGLRQAGGMDDLPCGLLARAALFRETRDLALARRDLEERCGSRSVPRCNSINAMPIWSTPVSRWRRAIGKKRADIVAEARRLVEETGYGRRRPEVEELEAQLP
jgi:hypothetical protein